MRSGPVTFVGHPFATTGVGEQLRSHVRAASAMLIDAKVYDLYGYAPRTDMAHGSLILPREVIRLPDGIRIFHINGDEVEPALERLRAKAENFENGHNIIVPAWELPAYPKRWVPMLRRFKTPSSKRCKPSDASTSW